MGTFEIVFFSNEPLDIGRAICEFPVSNRGRDKSAGISRKFLGVDAFCQVIDKIFHTFHSSYAFNNVEKKRIFPRRPGIII